jgi:hypothetical protein
MKNMENHGITAFILAVLQQTEQLPAPVQLEFNKINENFTIEDIETLVELHPSLLAAYEYADDCLMNGGNGRSKRSDAWKYESEEDHTAITELGNIIRIGDISDRNNLNQIITTIEAKVKPGELKEFLKEILKSGDSVQATKDRILSLIADRLRHE